MDLDDKDVRRVFHGELLQHLRQHGASSVSDLHSRGFSFFWLPFDTGEIREIVRSAHLHGLVGPLWPPTEAERTSDGLAWLPTDASRNVENQRSLSPVDLGFTVKKLAEPTRAAVFGWLSIALFVAAPIVSREELVGTKGLLGNRTIVVNIVAGLILAALMVIGTHGEYRLRKVARTWTRFAEHTGDALSRIKPWYLTWRAWPLVEPLMALLGATVYWAALNGPTALWIAAGGALAGVLGLATPRWWLFYRQIKQRERDIAASLEGS